MATIGVFDSGIGGLSVARALERAFPEDTILLRSDSDHMPYGDKSPALVLGYVLPILEDMVRQGCQAIVIACNTVTTTHMQELRRRISVPLIGIEPMVQAAARQTTGGTIAVCATPATLASDRYAWLKNTYAQDVRVLEPDCSHWAYMIEHNQINRSTIARQIDDVCAQGADVIVLGCTHYHWIERLIQEIVAGRAVILQPEPLVVEELKRILPTITRAPQP